MIFAPSSLLVWINDRWTAKPDISTGNLRLLPPSTPPSYAYDRGSLMNPWTFPVSWRFLWNRLCSVRLIWCEFWKVFVLVEFWHDVNGGLWAFHPIFVTWFLVVFGDQVTKILHNSLFTFFNEQGKTGNNGTHENLATYFWHFGSFDEKEQYENM